ncbi:MAG: mechanosensitive ion channel family protein [Bacteroidota bacterium]
MQTDFLNEFGLLGDLNIFNDQVLWGVSAWRLVAALFVIFLGFLSRKVITSLVGRLTRRVSGNTWKWDDEAVRLLPAPLALIAQVFLWRIAAAVLQLPTEPINVSEMVGKGLELALIVGVVWLLFRIVDVVALVAERASANTTTKVDDQIVPLMRKTLKVFVAVTATVMAVQHLGFSVTSVIASLGIGGLALALAAQDTVANFFGSVVIFADQPFQLGDWVAIGDQEGEIEEVGFRTTRLRRDDHALISIPNNTFTSAQVINFSTRDRRRMKVAVRLPLDAAPHQVERVIVGIRAVMERQEALRADTLAVYLAEVGDDGIVIEGKCYSQTASIHPFRAARQTILLEAMRLVRAEGLHLASTGRTIYMHDLTPTGDGHAIVDPDGMRVVAPSPIASPSIVGVSTGDGRRADARLEDERGDGDAETAEEYDESFADEGDED